ncbi:MAG TPA: 2-C-methyl-D-erythritol 2,4-cyclodiphosphate synthase [Ignavibacteriaceae bacterium]|nr:2-C-methyl-D-erythritol 2,4-cyclodiphosphate synthase [Ignavibacteriaceae bacterium]
MKRIKTGLGFDVHEFDINRKLILGGIEIPFDKGLLGHSDADALLHAICDAILGALALGDIGKHFPNNDEKYKNIDSKILLHNVNELIKTHGYEIGNIDAMLLLEKPKISPFIEAMRESIDSVIKIGIENISIKATTTETLGFVGREEGIAAMASVLLYPTEE